MSDTWVDLLIIGGGIAGISTALAIGRQGRQAHVLEREPNFGELGAGLQLAPNALRVLDQLNVLPQILSHAVFPKSLVLRDIVNGRRLKTLDLGPKFLERFGYPYIVMHRSDLLATLVDATLALGTATLESNKSVVDLDDLGDAVRVVCADGSSYLAKGVIAADGLWSSVRQNIFSGDEVKTPGYVAYRGTLPIEEVPAGTETNELLIWAGPNMHLVQYPVRGGAVYNQVAVFKTTPGAPGETDWGGPAELVEHFAQACDPVRAAITRISRDRRWPLFDRDPIHTWARNRIVLTGDAAHPMLQFLAQGACQALEDAGSMATWIDKLGGDYPRAFTLFQNTRVLRTNRVQLTARFFEHFWHPANVAADVRNQYLQNHPSDRYDEFDWLYGANATFY